MEPRCMCIDLRSAAHHLTQSYDEALAPAGLSVTQFSQLNLIRSMDAPTLSNLAQASQLERSTLGRNLKVLEKKGLIDTKIGTDARTKTIHLSRKGRAAFQQAVPLWHAAQTQFLERLGPGGRAQLDDMLAVLAQPLSNAQVEN